MGTNHYLDSKVFEAIIIQFQNIKREKAKLKLIVNDLKDASKRLSSSKDVKETLRLKKRAYKEAIKKFDDCQKELANSFYILSQNIVRYANTKYSNFNMNLIDVDDSIQECVLACFEKIDRFDPARGGSFNYFSTILINATKQIYRSAHNYKSLKDKFKDFSEYTQNSSRKHHKKI